MAQLFITGNMLKSCPGWWKRWWWRSSVCGGASAQFSRLVCSIIVATTVHHSDPLLWTAPLQYCDRFQFSQPQMQRSKRKIVRQRRRENDFFFFLMFFLALTVVKDDLKCWSPVDGATVHHWKHVEIVSRMVEMMVMQVKRLWRCFGFNFQTGVFHHSGYTVLRQVSVQSAPDATEQSQDLSTKEAGEWFLFFKCSSLHSQF